MDNNYLPFPITHRLVICEKPAQAKSYASALGAATQKNGYYIGNGYIVANCFGHLLELAPPNAYGEQYGKWRYADLPILPGDWKHVPSKGKEAQLKILAELMNRDDVNCVVNACDAGREGELIFRLVYEYANCKKPIKRLWISSMEESAVKAGFDNLKDGSEYDSLYAAASCRERADWLVGLNCTRLFTVLYGATLNTGRVQSPTLAMLCERENAIANFVKEKYHNVRLSFDAYNKKEEKVRVEGVSEKIADRSKAEKIKAGCDGNYASVKSVKREQKTVNPPKLYDLTTLQREANRLYGFTAQQTLDCTQSLYESKLVTYPRTDSRYLTEDMRDAVMDVVDIIMEFTPIYTGIGSYGFDGLSRVIDSSKVTDHHAIIPTTELAKANLDALPEGERKILYLIANRTVCAVAAKHEYESVTAEIECGDHIFTSRGKTVVSEGWKKADRIFKNYQKCKDEDDEIDSPLAGDAPLDLFEGQVFDKTLCAIYLGCP